MSNVSIGRSGIIKVTIFEAPITAMHLPGGMIWRWSARAARETASLARTAAPKRSGDLARSIRVRSEGRRSRKIVGYYVSANARTVPGPHWKHRTPYALFVHEGTGPYIQSNRIYPYVRRAGEKPSWGRGYLLVPKQKYMGRSGEVPRYLREKRKTVAGQTANPFLARPLRYVMSKVAK